MYFAETCAAAAVAIDVDHQIMGSDRLVPTELPAAACNARPKRLVVVSPFDEDLLALLEILIHTDWAAYWCATCRHATNMLRSNTVPVVICDENVFEGSWRKLLADLRSLREQPRFILTSDHPDDRLWAEALNLGAYDVLAKPFRADEVIRTLTCAGSKGYAE